MAWRAIGATAMLLAGVVPALAQGPMSPVPLAPNAFEVTTAIPLAPTPPTTTPATLSGGAGPAPAVTPSAPKSRRLSTATETASIKAGDAIAAAGSDLTTGDASDGVKPTDRVKPTKRRRSHDDASNTHSDTPFDSDHMASTLNRMQLSGSGSSQTWDRGPNPAAGD